MQAPILMLYVDNENTELYHLYSDHVNKHNEKMSSDPLPNSGFDLFFPETVVFESGYVSKFVSMGVKAEMICDNINCAFNIHPRSSISKTPLMLANHTGIIDMNYRGFLIGAFRNLSLKDYIVDKHNRLLQICHPSLQPFFVKLVKESDMSDSVRGTGGFGSSGL